MDFSVCSQCGIEIEGKGIHFRARVFCSDECCEEFEDLFSKVGEPDLESLDEDNDEDFDEEDLGYKEEEVEADSLLDDDYAINPEDF